MIDRKEFCLSPQEIERVLTEKGIQPTAQRIAIGRYVLCEADHPTAEEVKDWADKNFPKMSLATVYNTLHSLVDAGLLITLRVPDSDKVIYDNNVSVHHHFVDETTGKVFDVPLDRVSIEAKLDKKYKVRNISLIFKGKVS